MYAHIYTRVASLLLGMLFLTAVPWGDLQCPSGQSGQKCLLPGRVDPSRLGVLPLRPLEKPMLLEAHPGSLSPYLLTHETGTLSTKQTTLVLGIKKHLEGSVPILWVQSLFLTIWPAKFLTVAMGLEALKLGLAVNHNIYVMKREEMTTSRRVSELSGRKLSF